MSDNLEQLYPMSSLQQGILFHCLLGDAKTAYVEQLCYEVQGDLNVAFLRSAWEETTQAHPSLRAIALWERSGEPLQAVLREINLPWQEIDHTALPRAERLQRMDHLLHEDRLRGFELGNGPLFRLCLVHSDATTHHLIWTYHHLILDGWSVAIVLGDVTARYLTHRQGCEYQLRAARPYRDYIVWLKRQSLVAARDFWRNKLSGFTPTLAFSSEARNTSEPDDTQALTEKYSLDPATARELVAFARLHGLTTNVVWLGAFALLLSRYISSTDFAVGVTTSGRPPELEGSDRMVGMFINTIPLRCRPVARSTTLEWLRQLQVELGKALQHDILPLPDIGKTADLTADGGPLFDTLFVYENYPSSHNSDETDGLNIKQIRAFEQTNFPLMAAVNPGPETLVQLSYDPRHFDGLVVREMLENFVCLAQEMIRRPDAALYEYGLGSYPWARSEQSRIEGLTILHSRFAEHAKRTPDTIALFCASGELRYSELYRRAVRVAWQLHCDGVRAEDRVGICISRSEAVITAILATLFSGGAYVPIDPEWPEERIDLVLRDTDAIMILGERNVFRNTSHPRPVLWVEDFASVDEPGQEEPPSVAVFPGNIACMIYTSGSTGHPKGVAIQHGSISMFLDAMYRILSPQELSCVAATSSLTFDISIFEVFAPLGCGGSVALFKDVLSFPGAEHARHVSLVNSVPSAIAELLRIDRLPPSVRTICLAGEPLPRALAQALHHAAGDLRVINLYGPTEDTIFSLAADIAPGIAVEPPIGKPLLDREAWILDWALRPVPFGAEGEIYLAGSGLARGYWRRPGLTALRFVPHPFASCPGERLYRTGDRARLLSNRTIQCLGRYDEQVKLRGFRIEPGETDFILSSHPEVMQAVTLIQETNSGKRLASFVVPAEGCSLSPMELRSYVAARLPHYMVPSSIIILKDGMPTTPRGKLDRSALTKWKSQSEPRPDASISHSTIQDVVASIWAEVLALDTVDSEMSFFEQGGHSLLASQAVARLRASFQLDMPLRAVFEYSSVGEMARYVQSQIRSRTQLDVSSLVGEPHDGIAPCSFAQHRIWFMERLNPGQATYNINSAVLISGVLDIEALERSFDEIIARHEVLRTTIVADPKPRQVVHPRTRLHLPVEESPQAGTAFGRLLLDEALRPFALDKDPPIRLRLFRVRPDEHVLTMTLHHIACDGWSLAILGRELSELYLAFAAGQPSPLEPVPLQYADFARWQRDLLAGDIMEKHLTYWRERLREPLPALRLPGRRTPGPAEGAGGRNTFELPVELSNKLRQFARRRNLTLFSVLAGALQVVLCKSTGQTDVILLIDISNRDRLEFEGLIGLFVNQMLLRGDLRENPSFLHIAMNLQSQLLADFAYQHLPFDRVIQEMKIKREGGLSLIAPVKLVMQKGSGTRLELPGLTVHPIEVGTTPAARLDWTLAIEDDQGPLRLVSEYDLARYDQQMIVEMLVAYQSILSRIVADPQQRLQDLCISDPGSAGPGFDAARSQTVVSHVLDPIRTNSH